MSFDIKAAREICSRIKGYEDPDGGNFADFQAAEMLPAALDEIERLQTRDAAMQAQIVANAKRIAELEKKYKWAWVKLAENGEILQKQRTALKKLGQAKRERGKALVEERARRICHVPGDPVGHWARYEKVVVDEARERLRREGKL